MSVRLSFRSIVTQAMDRIMRNSQDEVRRSVGIGSPLDPNFQSSILATHTFSFLIRHTSSASAKNNPIKITGPQSSRTWRPNPSIITSCILILSSARYQDPGKRSNKKHKVARPQAFACASKYKQIDRKAASARALIHKKIRQRNAFFSISV